MTTSSCAACGAPLVFRTAPSDPHGYEGGDWVHADGKPCPGSEEEFERKAEAGTLTEEDWANHLRRMSRRIRGASHDRE
jgi:hypothetical protein